MRQSEIRYEAAEVLATNFINSSTSLSIASSLLSPLPLPVCLETPKMLSRYFSLTLTIVYVKKIHLRSATLS
jgi:hypothetical protein